MEELITIITPVYNRAHLIRKLYNSLNTQKKQNFCWMIIDDGSTDEIKTIVQSFMKSACFHIIFYQKENGGKHTALNLAFSNLSTELAVIVDCDDFLLEDATDIIEKKWHEYRSGNVAGMIFLKGYETGECVGKSELSDGVYDMIKTMFTHHIEGDKAEVFRCDILRLLRFPEFSGEKFMGEGYLWNQIYLKYEMIYSNQIIYICNYLEGGLTAQGRKLRIACPLGGMEYSKICFDKRFPIRERVKRAWLYVCYGKFARIRFKELVQSSGAPMLIKLNYIFGVVIYVYWKFRYSIKEDRLHIMENKK